MRASMRGKHLGAYMETLADIAWLCGSAGYYSGDSRTDIQTFIQWADEFTAEFTAEQEGDGEYMEAIGNFVDKKLRGELL